MQSQTSFPPALTDPVCGQPVNLASPFNSVHGGVMLCFCSEACRMKFADQPDEFVTLHLSVLDTPARKDRLIEAVPGQPTDAPAWVEVRPAPQKEVMAAQVAALPEAPQAAAQELPVCESPAAVISTWGDTEARDSTLADSKFSPSAFEADRRAHRSGLRNLLASNFLAWREGRHAARTSRQLLKLYRSVGASHPELRGRDLYRQVVMARNGCDTDAADRILDNAERSFADWPTPRDLTLCDVVHYLSMSEFLAMHDGEHWMHVDIGRVVAASIPRDLCLTRKAS